MKNKKIDQVPNQKPADPPLATVAGGLNQDNFDFPLPQEVAARAYVNYLNEGSQHGHDVEHWLHAEAELREERSRVPPGGHP